MNKALESSKDLLKDLQSTASTTSAAPSSPAKLPLGNQADNKQQQQQQHEYNAYDMDAKTSGTGGDGTETSPGAASASRAKDILSAVQGALKLGGVEPASAAEEGDPATGERKIAGGGRQAGLDSGGGEDEGRGEAGAIAPANEILANGGLGDGSGHSPKENLIVRGDEGGGSGDSGGSGGSSLWGRLTQVGRKVAENGGGGGSGGDGNKQNINSSARKATADILGGDVGLADTLAWVQEVAAEKVSGELWAGAVEG